MGQKGLISVSTFSVAKEYNFSRIDDDIILQDKILENCRSRVSRAATWD